MSATKELYINSQSGNRSIEPETVMTNSTDSGDFNEKKNS